MANRFTNPVPQFLDGSGLILAGAKCYFYVTGTSTPANTYTTEALSIANANPLVADSAGRLPACFLDPAVTYKVVLKTSADVEVWTRDPVVDLAANVTAKFQVHAGDPNGSVAGTAGTVGGVGASVVWDITNDLLYVCTTSGTASTAVWTLVAATLSGQVVQTGVITPTTLAANTDNWNPTGLSTASVIRMAASSAINLTGIVAQPTGALLTLHNIGSFAITLMDDVTSTAANRFDLPRDVVVSPGGAISLRYDGVSSRWRPVDVTSDAAPTFNMIYLQEAAAAAADVAGRGQFWVQNNTPNNPMFTDDAGQDAPLARIKTGSYTGDGATSQAITGIGFQVRFVKIWNRLTTDAGTINIWETTDVIVDDNASGMAFNYNSAPDVDNADNRIIALGTNGFTVDDDGADAAPNTNAVVYNFLCIG